MPPRHIQVTCPHCKRQTFVREHYNDPCEHCGRVIIMED